MVQLLRSVVVLCFIVAFAGPVSAKDYFPRAGDRWIHETAEESGFDPVKLQAAIDFAIANETKFEGDLADVASARNLYLKNAFDRSKEPFNSPIGPIKERGEPTGIILKKGYIVAEWGDPKRIDMTFSVSKTFLSSVAGIAYDRGLLPDVHEPAHVRGPAQYFESEHNQKITWDHLLRQTSGWQGTLHGKPDWADRPGEHSWSAYAAGPQEPGGHWKYNDVRVNMLALALMHVFEEPLPNVLKREVMDKIRASDTWVWHGYENSWEVIKGKRMQSVSGGGHWGGGMFISARDQARLGLLYQHDGSWEGRRIVSKQWTDMARTPTEPNPMYGYMNWFLNTGKERFASSPEDAVVFLGAGTNMIYVDRENELVAVVRWIDYRKRAEFVDMLMKAMEIDE